MKHCPVCGDQAEPDGQLQCRCSCLNTAEDDALDGAGLVRSEIWFSSTDVDIRVTSWYCSGIKENEMG